MALTKSELAALTKAFPELSWMKVADWQQVATLANWRGWLDESAIDETPRPENWPDYNGVLVRLLESRTWRVMVRSDCRAYFGADNVENINDPEDATWA